MSETKDPLLLWNFALAALLNGVIFAQMLYYRSVGSRSTSQSRVSPGPHVAEKGGPVQDPTSGGAASSAVRDKGAALPPQPPAAHSTPKRNPAGSTPGSASVTGSGGPGSAGRRYVRKLD